MKTQTLQLTDESIVQIDTVSSDVTVIGWHESLVQARVDTDEQDDIRIERTENLLRINAMSLKDAELQVQVPTGSRLRVSTVSGDISCRLLGGETTLNSTSGDISVLDLAGHLRIHNVSGDASVSGIEFSWLDIETVSGDISLHASLDQDGVYSLSTISGNLLLQLPRQERCLVQYQTLSGDFNCSLSHQVRHQGWGKLEAMLNDGGVAVRCSSVNGDLTIREIEARSEEPAAEMPPATEPTPTRPLGPFTLDEPPGPAVANPEFKTRLEILKAIEEGKLTVQEGLAQLQKLV
ncbi:MAG: DUF4097 family beta strand repeat-containing protein [Anaerolineae bacterium]